MSFGMIYRIGYPPNANMKSTLCFVCVHQSIHPIKWRWKGGKHDELDERKRRKQKTNGAVHCMRCYYHHCGLLFVIASYLALPVIAGIALIVFAIATAVVGIGAAAMLEVKAGYYACPREPVTSVTGSQ